MRPSVWCLQLLVGILVGRPPGPPVALQDAARFSPATADQGFFVTDPPVSVDWEALARQHFTRFDPFAPDSAALVAIRSHASELFGTAEIPYAVPLPAALASGHYYLATATGVHDAQTVELRGIVRFEVDRSGRLEGAPPRFYGSLLLRLADSLAGGEGGFAFRLASPWPEVHREAALRSRAAFLAAGLPPEPDKGDAAGWFRRVIMEYQLVVGTRRYVFQQLAPDHLVHEAGCIRRFRLFQVGTERELIAELNDGCDV